MAVGWVGWLYGGLGGHFNLVTYLILFVWMSHKAETRARHCSLSFDVFSSFPQVRLCSIISRSTRLLHVSFGFPLTHFPSGVHLRAIRTNAVSGVLKAWPIHCHLRRFISNVMGCIDVLLWSSAFEMVLGQNILSIL